MRYISTRGQAPALSFEDVVLTGLASDGGLYVPEFVPQLSPQEIAALADLSYPELAARIMQPFVGDFDKQVLLKLCQESYAEFRHAAIAPLKQLSANHWLLELFHGPTLAFKDFALQFLGRLLDHILQKRNERIVIVGATSGDTGSAAIAGCRGRDNMQIVILHPKGRVSEVQRRQMTTYTDANVHNVALSGTFDDCQDMVKALFNDNRFRTKHSLAAVNSINWARVLAQVVYYFYSALALGAPARELTFSVPTGNFGDIYAGYIAKQMGLPIRQLIIATNRNDILARGLKLGKYEMQNVVPSLSPSMDIQVSSNFERLMFDLMDKNGSSIAEQMQQFRKNRSFTLSEPALNQLRRLFTSESVQDDKTQQVIAEIYETTGEIVDPHTAVGIAAANACYQAASGPIITLSTAHPAKFPDAVEQACGVRPQLPSILQDLFARPERFTELDNNIETVKQYIEAIKK